MKWCGQGDWTHLFYSLHIMTSPVFSQMTLLDIFVQALWSHRLANDVRDLFFCFFSPVAGDIWNDARREAVDRRPQFGQKGLFKYSSLCVAISVVLVRCWLMLYPALHFQVYYEPMLKLDIMTESELGQIFGTLDSLIPLHEGVLVQRWYLCYRWRQK